MTYEVLISYPALSSVVYHNILHNMRIRVQASSRVEPAVYDIRDVPH
jgi:hypothetical protein